MMTVMTLDQCRNKDSLAVEESNKMPSLGERAISVWIALCWHSNSKQDAARQNTLLFLFFVAGKCHGGIV